MARLSVSYGGGKRFMAEVRGHRIESDQREKGGGQDSAPEPFDIFVASHAMCMMLFAQIFLERNELSTEGLSLEVEYEMADHPRRLGKVHGILHVPNAELGKRAPARCTTPSERTQKSRWSWPGSVSHGVSPERGRTAAPLEPVRCPAPLGAARRT